MNIRYYMSIGLALILLPFIVFAGEKVSGTDFFVDEPQFYPTGEDTAYWVWHGKGIQYSAQGPLGTNPMECHGAGFLAKEGSWGEGICLIGEKDDTRVTRWWWDIGEEVRHWEHLSGTGKYANWTGKGTFKNQRLSENRSISEWEGEVTLGE